MPAETQPLLNISLFNLLREELGATLPLLHCTKATLVHLSHTIEDLVLSDRLPTLLFTGFQESSHWREETQRYRALAEVAQQVCIFAGGQLPPESNASELHVTLRGDDPLRQEWFLVLLCPQFAALLCGQDRMVAVEEEALRQFDTIWSFDPAIITRVLDLLEQVVGHYRPERLEQLRAARQSFPPCIPDPAIITRLTAELVRFEEQLHQSLQRTTVALNAQLRWRDDLTATLVHDMRTPLQGVVLALDMLEHELQPDSEMIKHLLAAAKRGAGNLKQLVQLMLDTNQLSAGQLALDLQPVSPQSLATGALASLRPLAAEHELDLALQVDPRLTLLWCDPSLLERVIQNLVGNAIKFSAPRGRIDVGLAPAPTGREVELRVRDTGRGIAPSALPHIFDRYYQARVGDRQGTGLGLYFCRLVAEAHHGSIRAASQLGYGTTVTLVLPVTPPLI